MRLLILLLAIVVVIILILMLLVKSSDVVKNDTNKATSKDDVIWKEKVNDVSDILRSAPENNIKVINNMDLDRLIHVRGKNRPMAVFIPPRASNLNENNVFIYDTRKTKDNSLYLYAGMKSNDFQIELGRQLMKAMIETFPPEHTYEIIRDDGPDFARLIHTIGGHKDDVQSAEIAGDDLFFENVFFKTLLHLHTFIDGKITNLDVQNPLLSMFPENGAAVIDTSDLALYLWIGDKSDPQNEQDAANWLKSQKEYNNRELLIFRKERIPANLKIIFRS